MKIVTAKFTESNYTEATGVYQWNYGQILRIEGLKLPWMVEVHFSLQATSGEALIRIGTTKDGVTDVIIPDSMLENEGIGTNYKIYAWVYLTDKDSGSTEYKITIHVKARAKPEITHGGENGDIFQETIEIVKESMQRAEEAQRQAEGFAHGREDLPERAEDNAKYYADKASTDAEKTAADRKEVERLVESVTGIDQQMASKLDKNQGAENAGKALVIGQDGNVVPGEVTGSGDGADAILNTAKGNLLLAKDSAERKNKGFRISGKTEQNTTTGTQLFDISKVIDSDNVKVINNEIHVSNANFGASASVPNLFKDYFPKAEIGKTYTLFFGYKNRNLIYLSGLNQQWSNGSSKVITQTILDSEIYFYSSENEKNVYSKIMLNEGSITLPYEPYTGGKPSPSPEYPQEIVNAGKWNEAKQKYEIDVRVNTGNLFNETTSQKGYYIGDVGGKLSLNSTIGYSYETDINIGAGVEITVSIQATVNTRLRIYAVDFSGIILYKYDDSSANASDNNHTFIIPDRTKKILVSILEISGPEDAIIMVNVGKTQLPYEPYKEQTLTLTSDRLITKWDKLVEQDGQIGWLYATKFIEDLAEIVQDNTPIYGVDNKYFSIEFENENFDYDTTKVVSETGLYNVNKSVYAIKVMQKAFLININSEDTIQTAKEHLHYSAIYNSVQTEFVPLPQEQQDAIRALHTYYPTTVATNNAGLGMEMSYVADTKNYVDGKIKDAVTAQLQNTASLLSLMPLSTQATMIENDTNNTLDNMEVQE